MPIQVMYFGCAYRMKWNKRQNQHSQISKPHSHVNLMISTSVVMNIEFPPPPRWLDTTDLMLSSWCFVYSVLGGLSGYGFPSEKQSVAFLTEMRPVILSMFHCRCDVRDSGEAEQTSDSIAPPRMLCSGPTVQLIRWQHVLSTYCDIYQLASTLQCLFT